MGIKNNRTVSGMEITCTPEFMGGVSFISIVKVFDLSLSGVSNLR